MSPNCLDKYSYLYSFIYLAFDFDKRRMEFKKLGRGNGNLSGRQFPAFSLLFIILLRNFVRRSVTPDSTVLILT